MEPDLTRVLAFEPGREIAGRVESLPAVNVESESDPERGLERLLMEPFDVALVAGNLGSGQDGVELIRRAVSRDARTPLVLVASPVNGTLRAAVDAGAFTCVDPARTDPPDLESAIAFASANRARVEDRRERILGRIGSFLAHDGKNALAGIGGAVQVISDHLPAGHADRVLCQGIRARLDEFTQTLDALTLLLRPLGSPPQGRVTLGDVIPDRDDLGSTVNVEVSGKDLTVQGDRALLERLFTALVENAAEAVEGEGKIRLDARREGDTCVVEVTDTGPEAAPRDVTRLLDLFYTTKRRRAGLGLPLAKRIAEAHGGSLRLSSSPGSSLLVTIRLPAG